MTDIGRRKEAHLDIVLGGVASARSMSTGFELLCFEHNALPELDYDKIDLGARFLGRRLAAPLLISSMTGGPERARAINQSLARAAAALRIAFAVGSQRIALEHSGDGGLGPELRKLAPDVPLLANLGASQIRGEYGVELARRAVGMIEADALIVHLNPLQEAVQEAGDRDWTGVLAGIGRLCDTLEVPVVVKEVGGGISAKVARQLHAVGVRHIDVAGLGGTSWAAVEAERATGPRAKSVAEAFRDWGVPTAIALPQVRACCPDAVVIASGGVRDGIDVAKAIRLGADIAGQAASTLPAAIEGVDAVVEHFSAVIDQLRVACFCTGSKDLAALRRARLVARPTTPAVDA